MLFGIRLRKFHVNMISSIMYIILEIKWMMYIFPLGKFDIGDIGIFFTAMWFVVHIIGTIVIIEICIRQIKNWYKDLPD